LEKDKYAVRHLKSPGLPELISLGSGGMIGSGIYPGILKELSVFGCVAGCEALLVLSINDNDSSGNRTIRIPNPDHLPIFYITGNVMVREGGRMRENILMAAAIIVFSCVPVVQLFGGF
jgi:hypothetical protein